MLFRNAVRGLFQEGEAAPTAGAAAKEKKIRFSNRDYDVDKKTAYFEFGNQRTLELNCGELPAEIQIQLMLHGAIQKVGDSYAGAKGDYEGAIANAQGVIDALKAGEWGVAGDEARPRLAELAEAISRIKGTDLEKTKVAVEKATDEQRKQWRSNAKVKATIAQLRAEKAQKALEAAGEQTLDIAVEA